MIARDGEGASKLVSCLVKGASSEECAERLAMGVISSSLVKAAMYGSDANWGRVLCAMGYSKAPFKPDSVDVAFYSSGETIEVCKDGAGLPFDEEFAKRILSRDEIRILVDLHDGGFEAEAFGCDLTHEYVSINGDYRT
jgi:glutamate N-acetyltransferase/amino-acid N-acetyltransferase